jgi:mRNA interferase MazF
MISEAFEVVVVPFPFIDMSVSKPRPALVLSTGTFNEANGHTLLAMITTAARSRWPSDQPIADLASAGLRTPCVVRLKLFTLENRLLDRGVGALVAGDREAVGARLEAMLARE